MLIGGSVYRLVVI